MDIDDGEAEWCLQTIEALFRHYYVEPDRLRKQIRDAQIKLGEAEDTSPDNQS